MTDELSTDRRLSFGQVAELYEQARPSYPDALVDDVIAYAGLLDDDAIVEVGAGTGKATRLFAARGYRVVALEPSAEMAEVAGRLLGSYPAIQIVETDFESWEAAPVPFGLLISAQAWHWTDPKTRYANARRVLRPGGALAAFWNENHWEPSQLRTELDQAYEEAFPDREFPSPMRAAGDRSGALAEWSAEISGADGFDDAEVRDYPWLCRYTADEYVRLISTHSDHVILDRPTRDRLLDRVSAAIKRHGGAFEVRYVSRLFLARAV